MPQIQAAINRMKNGPADEIYTPEEAILPILPFLDKSKTYWECTDFGGSMITKVLKENGFKVVTSHKKDGFDFLTDTPDFEFDFIITNPPYSIKDKFLARAASYGKPFAYLIPLTSLEGKARHKIYKTLNAFGVCVFDGRVSFNGFESKSNYFNTSWFFGNYDKVNGIKFIELPKIKTRKNSGVINQISDQANNEISQISLF